MFHFAYGSNMSRAVMRKHAPGAEPIGVAVLANYRFIITADGYGSVEPMRAAAVHGVLWRLTPRDRAGLDAWESVASGSYRAATLAVRCARRCQTALVYLGRPCGIGRAKSGYVELVIAAALAWELPPDYVVSLQQWLPAHPVGIGVRKLGEFEWT
jgi:AIG2-like family